MVHMVRSGQYMWYIWCDQGSTCGTYGAIRAVHVVRLVRFVKCNGYGLKRIHGTLGVVRGVFQTLYVLESLGAQAAGPIPCECNRLPTWTEMRIPFCTLHAVTFV